MTAPEGRRDRAMPLRMQFRREDTGTLLGALAWVLGALEIMRDRGHAEEDEEFHQLYDRIAPKLNFTMTPPRFEEPIETAYAEVRDAFESWIRLTAMDTLAIATAERVDDEHAEGNGAGGADPE